MQQSTPQVEKASISQEEVYDYLQNNPDFFLLHGDILEHMKLPSSSDGNITGFHDFQVKKLKSKIQHLEERNKLLIQTSLSNHKSERDINKLILEILSAGSREQLNKVLTTSLKDQMNLDSVILNLNENITPLDGETGVQLRTLSKPEERLLHGEGSQIQSDAHIFLQIEGFTFGMLILGSNDVARFHVGQGTEILEFLGQVLSLCLLKLEK